MFNRRVSTIMALVCGAVLATGCTSEGPDAGDDPRSDSAAPQTTSAGITPSPGRPVLLVTIDTLRADALGSYGSATRTPALDALAAEGVLFRNAVAHSVLTFPSHSSILTGLDPSRHGVHDNDRHRMPESALTWAERLKVAGYDTGAFIGAFPLDSVFGLAQGFDIYDDAYGAGGDGQRLDERIADRVVAAASDWLQDRAAPWFAWVHVYDPHAPYTPPAPFDAEYPDDPYAGEVAYVDAMLAPLIAEARRRDAIVVVTADHGESLGEHGEATHGVFAYAATLHVPLMIAGLDGVTAGHVVTERVRHVDVLPTVLDALGLSADGMQGVSMSAAIAGDPHPATTSYFEALTPFFDWGWAPLRGIYSGALKYIELPIPELYDLSTAAGESVNLADTRNVDLARLATELREHLAAAPEANAATRENPETLRRLRALGYVGNTVPAGPEADDFGPEDDPKRLIEIEGQIQVAMGAVQARDFGVAVSVLEGILARRPGMARVYTLLASAREGQAGPAAAAAVLERAMGEGVVTPHLLGRLAFFYRRAGRLGEAATAAEQALEQQPDDVESMSLLATIYGEVGRVTEAEALLARALEFDPSYARLYANLGTLYLSTERPAAAAEAFRKGLEFDAYLADAHNGLGVLANAAGDLPAAVEHWQQALRIQPNQPFVLYNMGVVLGSLGRIPEAIEAIDRYVVLRPNDAEAKALLAELRNAAG